MGGVIVSVFKPHHTTPHTQLAEFDHQQRGKGSRRDDKSHHQQEQREGEGTVESMGGWPLRRSWKREVGGLQLTYQHIYSQPHHHTHITLQFKTFASPVVDRIERQREINFIVSEGIEVWVSWLGVKKIAIYIYMLCLC